MRNTALHAYKVGNIFFVLFCFAIVISVISCVPDIPKEQSPELEYRVIIPDMPLDSIHVSLTINSWHHGTTINLYTPPSYADNPILTQTGINFCNFRMTDAQNNEVFFTLDSMHYGIYSMLTIHTPAIDEPLDINYDVKFLYQPHKTMPSPNIGANVGYLQGNYVFLVPYFNDNILDIWRSSFDIAVTYTLGNRVLIFGDPVETGSFKNPYELLFSTSALISTDQQQNQILFSGETQGQKFRFVNISTTVTFSQTLLDSVQDNFITIVNDIAPNFGVLDEVPVTVLVGINDKIGLEGMYSFCLRNPKSGDVQGVVNMTMAHEFLHSWIGVRVGEYEDPWWKEGTATYLGLLVPKRNGLCTESYIQESLLDTFTTDVQNAASIYALSDPAIREHTFDGTPGVGTLVYRKGAQVCMLLDRAIREASRSKVTFDMLLGSFVQHYSDRAFHHSEYSSFLHDNSGADVQSIFTTYVDQKGLIPYQVLVETYAALDSLGAFGE